MEKKNEKQQSLLKQLFVFAGSYKYLSILSVIFAGISALIALVPFYYIWRIMQEVLRVGLQFSQAEGISSYGWHAVGFALLGMILYIAALMCSHIAAFHVQASMRTIMMEHIMTLPLGYIESEGSGKIRKIVTDSSAATETYLAHNLPDKAVSAVTPVGLLILMFVFDWRLGLICLIPAALGFVCMGSMMGKGMEKSMQEYQNSLEVMSAEAVEYVRGIPVVKTFGQSVFSFKRFKNAIDNYEKWTVDYTKRLMKPMIGFTTAVNSTFAFIIAAAFLLGGNHHRFRPESFLLHYHYSDSDYHLNEACIRRRGTTSGKRCPDAHEPADGQTAASGDRRRTDSKGQFHLPRGCGVCL